MRRAGGDAKLDACTHNVTPGAPAPSQRSPRRRCSPPERVARRQRAPPTSTCRSPPAWRTPTAPRGRRARPARPRRHAGMERRPHHRAARRARRPRADAGAARRARDRAGAPRRWARVVVADQPTPLDRRGYPGWIPVAQLAAAGRFGRDLAGPIVVVTAPTAWLASGSRRVELSYGTRLPLISSSKGSVLVEEPSGTSGRIPATAVTRYRSAAAIPRPTGAAVVAAARAFLGVRYLWGGTSAFGWTAGADRARVPRPRDGDPARRRPAGPLGQRRLLEPAAARGPDLLRAPDGPPRGDVRRRWVDARGAGLLRLGQAHAGENG